MFSYFIYPILLQFLAKNKTRNSIIYQANESLPNISVLMSLYNEEKVILKKLESLYHQDYPKENYQVFIGSDHSSDQTNSIITTFIQENNIDNFHFSPFKIRQGKPGVINQLVKKAKEKYGNKNHIFISTDASVILNNNVLFHLAKHFKNEQIGLVDSNLKHTGIETEGISKSEDNYISKEVQIKNNESLYSGKMMGPFGACYAIRSELYKPVPSNYLVDDFYLSMHVLDQGKDVINDLDAICYESVSQHMDEEFRRKARISAGNFQNLATYLHLLNPLRGKIAFNFLSHKVLRWLGPFFILASFFSNFFLLFQNNLFYFILFTFQAILIFFIPIFDWILQKLNINIGVLRTIRYFFVMNLALLKGFFNYFKGIKSNVWQPTKRPD